MPKKINLYHPETSIGQAFSHCMFSTNKNKLKRLAEKWKKQGKIYYYKILPPTGASIIRGNKEYQLWYWTKPKKELIKYHQED